MEWFKPNGWFIGLVVAVVALFVAAGWVAGQRQFTPLESLLLQLLVLLVGVGATMVTGYQSARRMAGESTRQHARSAFKRLTTLYGGYTRMGDALDRQRRALAGDADADGRIPAELVGASLELLEVHLNEQYDTLEDALADWRELDPVGVTEIERQLGRRLGR